MRMVQLPPSKRDWLPSGHLAWFIHDAVEGLKVDKLLVSDRQRGKGQRCPPRVMLRLLIYAYCTGTFSSRRIAANIEVSIAFRVLAAGHEPDHHAICRFREENLDEINRCFMQVVEIAHEAKLVKMGTIVVDSSRAKGKASEHKAKSAELMPGEKRRLREEIAKLTRSAKQQDELEDDSLGPDAVTACRPKRSEARTASKRSQ
jgi:transposase